MPLVGIRTHDLSRRAAEDVLLRQRGHWDRQFLVALRSKQPFDSSPSPTLLLPIEIKYVVLYFCVCSSL
jgi:hypothetical protein